MENLDRLVRELISLPQETEWLEFKKDNYDPKMIGERISALANVATLLGREQAYIIWGIDDQTHKIKGTSTRLQDLKKGSEHLETWLARQLSGHADFAFHSVVVEGKLVNVIIIKKAIGYPINFEHEAYFRIGSHTKKLKDYPEKQAILWEKLRNTCMEDVVAKADLTLGEVRRMLFCDVYFKILNSPLPQSEEGYAHPLMEEGLIKKQDDGLYSITNLGALLLAVRLSEFPRISRKAIRIVQYGGRGKTDILRSETLDEGYATSFRRSIDTVRNLLPSQEKIQISREVELPYPIEAIREALANALIHQDLLQTGNGPILELFENRIEILNPGIPLVDINRIVDNPPKSRNEKLASLMRRMRLCEELGSGWDRMVSTCEAKCLPAPRIHIYEESTRVTLLSHLDYSAMAQEDKVWSAYLHACIKHFEGETLSNSSLRERFGLPDTSAASISRLIKETVDEGWIKPLDPAAGKKHMKYIPFWG